jgi:hypothetical protein
MERHETNMFFESRLPVVICKGFLKVRREVLIDLRNDTAALSSRIAIAVWIEGVDAFRTSHVEHRTADPELASNRESASGKGDLL